VSCRSLRLTRDPIANSGNDIVVIVYVEPGATFDPCMMKTQFNRTHIPASRASTRGGVYARIVLTDAMLPLLLVCACVS
jgi:hypothetical protein